MNFEFSETFIEGLFVIHTSVYTDSRGYFKELYNENEFAKHIPNIIFVQDNLSKSTKGVLRGMHLQINHPQAKLISVLEGEVFDVAVDMRKDSKTYLKWYGIRLSQKNGLQLFIPEGFAHGFLVLSDEVLFSYKCSDFYYPNDESGIAWDDPKIGIDWPICNQGIILSEKDSKYKHLLDEIYNE